MKSLQDTPLGREMLMGEALKVPISRFKREMQGLPGLPGPQGRHPLSLQCEGRRPGRDYTCWRRAFATISNGGDHRLNLGHLGP